MTLSIAYATLVNNRQVGDLWAGLREVVQVSHPGATLSAPVQVRTTHGYAGDVGLVKAPGLAGTASVFAGPSRQYRDRDGHRGPERLRPAEPAGGTAHHAVAGLPCGGRAEGTAMTAPPAAPASPRTGACGSSG